MQVSHIQKFLRYNKTILTSIQNLWLPYRRSCTNYSFPGPNTLFGCNFTGIS